MNHVKDLNIDTEIKPLFDFTHNLNSGEAVATILSSKLDTIEDILFRQRLLKGFIENWKIIKDYSFYRYNLSEVQDFFNTIFIGSISRRKLRMKFLFSEKERHQKKGKLILLVRLFYSIHHQYLSKIDTSFFPQAYIAELEQLKGFFEDFDLHRYETAFNKDKFGISHMIQLIFIITKKIANGEVDAFFKRWCLFEAYLSIAMGIVRNGYSFPTFDDAQFSLEGFYHPVLKNPVTNNFTSSRQVILLTGPNMSGKSTLLKALSLCVYLAHTGLAVPASKAVMPFFNHISVAINLTDSIVSGYSHFMSEIITLKKVLAAAKTEGKCFAVFDELFRGTNIEDALEISTSTLKGLTQFQDSFFFISTHLHQLKDMKEIRNGNISTCFIDCVLTDNFHAFTYKIKEGWSDLKLGRVLFDKEGLNTMLEG